jgi:prophage antirepressor-like protein
MNNLTLFKDNSGLFQVRVIDENGEPWFVAEDVCDNLEIDKTQTRRLDQDEKGLRLIQTLGGMQNVVCVNEPGLYSLVLSSRKPEAKSFKRWITHDVIPQIRKTGSYSVSQFQIPQTFSEALRLAADLADQNQKMLPKAESFDRFISADNLQNMNVVAKTLGWGRNKLFRELRDRRILLANNTPYQEYIERGYFEVKQKPIRMGESEVDMPQTFVTARGIEYLSKVLHREEF